MASKRRVSYYYDNDVGNYSYGLGHPMKPHRIRMAHQLVSAYGMLESMDVVRPSRATPLQMTRFHTDEYVDFLNRVTPETSVEMTGGGTRFLVGEDNPAFDGLFEFCSISAGGSINAAERLNSGKTDIGINWAGGLHHAKKREASGFCYVNDIVLSILELLRYHARVLYIDIDCHHGDGVEEAFYTTDRVMTCSFHKQKDYFPGTGRMEDTGKSKGKGYSVNIPLLNGVTDEEYQSIFEPVMQHIMDWYRPGAVVLQCGADSLSGDKLGVFNLSMHGHANCVRFLRAFNVPLILLGGGGYTIKNVSCAWTYETACALGIEKEIDLNLPYNPYLEYYGPRYRLEVEPSNMTDDNPSYLEQTKIQILEGLRDLPFAPSIGMQNVPSASVSQETGIRVRDGDGDSDMSDLDVQIAQRVRSAFADRSSSATESDSDEPLRSRHPHSLLSYFPNRQRHRDTNSSEEDDDDETESEVDDDDENDSEFRRRSRRRHLNGRAGHSSQRRSSRHRSSKTATLPADGIDGLVFGNRSWLDPPVTNSKPPSQRNSKRTFFKQTGPVWSSGADRALALGLSTGRDVDGAEDGMDLNDDNDGGSGVGSIGWSGNTRDGGGLQPYSYPYRTSALGNAASPMSLS